MKLQYLGDARDAFKWDLLHWLCTRSSPPFSKLVFIPLLTPDVKGSTERLTPHHWFDTQDFIRPFLASLNIEPRSLERISALGSVQPQKEFQVCVFAPDKFIASGPRRFEYWSNFDASKLDNSVVFFDPDKGYETKTQNGPEWIRHSELADLFSSLPKNSVAVVYQHRPRRTWHDLFVDLTQNFAYVHTVLAAYDPNLAFVAMAKNAVAGKRISTAFKEYARIKNQTKKFPIVSIAHLRPLSLL